MQLFAIIKEYENAFTGYEFSTNADLCTMIEYKVNNTMHAAIDPSESSAICQPVSLGYVIEWRYLTWK